MALLACTYLSVQYMLALRPGRVHLGPGRGGGRRGGARGAVRRTTCATWRLLSVASSWSAQWWCLRRSPCGCMRLPSWPPEYALALTAVIVLAWVGVLLRDYEIGKDAAVRAFFGPKQSEAGAQARPGAPRRRPVARPERVLEGRASELPDSRRRPARGAARAAEQLVRDEPQNIFAWGTLSRRPRQATRARRSGREGDQASESAELALGDSLTAIRAPPSTIAGSVTAAAASPSRSSRGGPTPPARRRRRVRARGCAAARGGRPTPLPPTSTPRPSSPGRPSSAAISSGSECVSSADSRTGRSRTHSTRKPPAPTPRSGWSAKASSADPPVVVAPRVGRREARDSRSLRELVRAAAARSAPRPRAPPGPAPRTAAATAGSRRAKGEPPRP